jgi:DNA sulfur modification protein DndC
VAQTETILSELKEQYLEDDKMPWVVGYSGGKDSSMLLQLVVQMLLALPKSKRKKDVHVLSNDTLVENPFVSKFLDGSLAKLKEFAAETQLPLIVVKTTPILEDTFWFNLIGKGYPSPNRWFRWCTERMKIDPTSKYILKQVSKYGQVVILLGARKDESLSRAQIMDRYDNGQRLRKHSTLPNASVFTPLADVATEEVWTYLLQVDSPWGADNRWLIGMYRNASGGDCPLVVDTSTPSCGNSRFGCWVCTVVENDKSMQGLVDNGEDWMYPMLELRNWLKQIRDDVTLRDTKRRNGQDGAGPFLLDTRKEVLRRLLGVQKSVREETGEPVALISKEELSAIQLQWHYDGDSDNSVQRIYEQVFNMEVDLVKEDMQKRREEERQLLKEVCSRHDVPLNLVEDLVIIEQLKSSLIRRHNLFNEIDEELETQIRLQQASQN